MPMMEIISNLMRSYNAENQIRSISSLISVIGSTSIKKSVANHGPTERISKKKRKIAENETLE